MTLEICACRCLEDGEYEYHTFPIAECPEWFNWVDCSGFSILVRGKVAASYVRTFSSIGAEIRTIWIAFEKIEPYDLGEVFLEDLVDLNMDSFLDTLYGRDVLRVATSADCLIGKTGIYIYDDEVET